MDIDIAVYQWKGNKDVLLKTAKVQQVPRLDDLVEFSYTDNQIPKKLRGKVTRVLHDLDSKVVNVRVTPKI